MLRMISLYGTNCFADDAEVTINNSIMDKQAVIAGFKGHHSIYNNIQIPNITAQTKYFKDGSIWTNEWVSWMGTGNKLECVIQIQEILILSGTMVNCSVSLLFDTAGLNMELAAQ